MKNGIEKIQKILLGLWQSRKPKYKTLRTGGIIFIVFAVVFLLLSCFIKNENIIIAYTIKFIYLYFVILGSCLSIILLLFYFYIFNKINRFKNLMRYLCLVLMGVLLIALLVIGIPFVVLTVILDKILDYRAKKIDNLIDFFIFAIITASIIGILIYPTFILSYYISKLLEYILAERLMFNLSVYSMGLFVFLAFLKLEADIFFKGLLLIKEKALNKSIKKKLKAVKSNFDKRIDASNFDIKVHVQNKSDVLKKEEAEFKNDLYYDITYSKNTLRKIQLAILILLFVIVSLKIAPREVLDLFNQYQSDTINVLTVYTLIMLYLDKRKEWK